MYNLLIHKDFLSFYKTKILVKPSIWVQTKMSWYFRVLIHSGVCSKWCLVRGCIFRGDNRCYHILGTPVSSTDTNDEIGGMIRTTDCISHKNKL